ncbi:MAG: Na/Pi cotransporter family protein [Spirochaetaceae bacterium]|jgi:phosphate:Na+ symporter|nr:Na/Pi cotransporter family protein [Spirochaetaceae bacterium]
MRYLSMLFGIMGSLGLFLYGMKVMSSGIQKTAGSRFQRALGFMTGTRISGILTGFAVTAIIQSSSAATVMVVSFVNAGLLTLTQAIGVIMGANIGTTVTAWIVSLVGFTLSISALALPAVGLGFIASFVKGKYQNAGEVILGFGLLFLGLDFLTKAMPTQSAEQWRFLASVTDLGVFSILIGTGIGLVLTLLVHSSSASTAIILTMAHNTLIPYEMAAAMILGANIGTTLDAALAAIGAKTAARQAALVHILFNVIGTVWALLFFKFLLILVDRVSPEGVTARLAMLHTVFNVLNTLLFLPFVKPFARLVTVLVKDDGSVPQAYTLPYQSGSMQDTPELNILRAEKEIRDMAELVFTMYRRIREPLRNPGEGSMAEAEIAALLEEAKAREQLADDMREELTRFLIECTRQQLSRESEHRVSQLLRILANLEDMTDDCYGVVLILERSVKKGLTFKRKEIEAMNPYLALVETFLTLVREHLSGSPGDLRAGELRQAEELKKELDKSRSRLKKLGRKRIEAGQDVKTELLFIDLVRRIEQLGDSCGNIAELLTRRQ